MILFLGDSFTWGQGLYFEKWKSEGINVIKWKKKYGDVDSFPHENLDYNSDCFRKENHFPALVAKHYDRCYNVKWGNGGSNWDVIHQINAIPTLSPQFRNGLDLVVIQLTDWTRNDNRVLYENDLYEQAIPNMRYLMKKKGWEDELITEMMKNEALYQVQKMKELLDELGKKWIVISWRNDMGEIIKEQFPENYVPFYYQGEEHSAFEICLERGSGYTLEDEFNDGHLNTKGCQLVADSIIKKIETLGGKSIFRYINRDKHILI
jgi:lysophospholipase L1-like esterase